MPIRIPRVNSSNLHFSKSSWSSLWRNLRTKREAWREMDKNVIFNYDFYSDTTEDVEEELPEINEFELEEALGITPMKLY